MTSHVKLFLGRFFKVGHFFTSLQLYYIFAYNNHPIITLIKHKCKLTLSSYYNDNFLLQMYELFILLSIYHFKVVNSLFRCNLLKRTTMKSHTSFSSSIALEITKYKKTTLLDLSRKTGKPKPNYNIMPQSYTLFRSFNQTLKESQITFFCFNERKQVNNLSIDQRRKLSIVNKDFFF